jgi:hypothetical protein
VWFHSFDRVGKSRLDLQTVAAIDSASQDSALKRSQKDQFYINSWFKRCWKKEL